LLTRTSHGSVHHEVVGWWQSQAFPRSESSGWDLTPHFTLLSTIPSILPAHYKSEKYAEVTQYHMQGPDAFCKQIQVARPDLSLRHHISVANTLCHESIETGDKSIPWRTEGPEPRRARSARIIAIMRSSSPGLRPIATTAQPTSYFASRTLPPYAT